MDRNSGDCTQSPSSSQGLKRTKEDGATSLPHADSKDDGDRDNYNNDSCTDDSQLTERPERTKENIAKKPECTKENTASPYFNRSKLTEILKHVLEYVKHYRYDILMFIAVVVFAVWCKVYIFSPTAQDTAKVTKPSLREAIKHISEEFPSQLEHIWTEFSAGINETAQGNPTKPSVFMLLYETDERTAICLAQKVGNMSTHVLEAKKSNPLLIIDGADLEHNEALAEDYGKLLEEYRPKVEEQRAMIINNLHKIPGTVAQSFHSFCDIVSPAVGKAVYLFTMKASQVISNRCNPTEVAEEELRKLWSDELDNDKLNPLITRITDVTMMIRPEKNLAPC